MSFCHAGEIAPTVVAATAFSIHVFVYHRPLSAPQGFAALTLFSILRFPLNVFPEIISLYVSASLSMDRIQKFLDVQDIEGLKIHFSEKKDLSKSKSNNQSTSLDVKSSHSPREESRGATFTVNVILASFGWTTVNLQSTENKNDDVQVSVLSKVLTYWPCCKTNGILNSLCRNMRGNDKTLTKAYENIHTQDFEEDDSELPLAKRRSRLLRLKDWIGQSLGYEIDSNSRSKRFQQQEEAKDIEMQSISPTLAASSALTVLRDLTLALPKNKLTVLGGPTGCGKSTLVSGILGECLLIQGGVSIDPQTVISYVPQSAWIQNATLRENILFGEKYDQDRYLSSFYHHLEVS